MASNRHTPETELSQNPIAVRKREARRRAREDRQRAEAELPPLPPEPEPGEPTPRPEPEPTPASEPAVPEPTITPPAAEAPPTPEPPLGEARTPPGISVDRTYTPRGSTDTGRPVPRRDTAWHRKWRSHMVGGGGREQACEMAAEQCVQVALKMDQIIIAAGGTPRAPAESMRAPLVLTIDQLMPDKASDMLEKPIWQLLFVLGISVGQTLMAVQAMKRAGAQTPVTDKGTPQPPPQPPPQPTPPVQRTVVQPPPQHAPEWPMRVAPLPPAPPAPTRAELAQFQTETGDYTV